MQARVRPARMLPSELAVPGAGATRGANGGARALAPDSLFRQGIVELRDGFTAPSP